MIVGDVLAVGLQRGSDNEPPVIVNQAFSISDAANAGATVGTAAATDPESGSLTFAFTGGDTANFAISSSGVITTLARLDSFAQNHHVLTVEVTDDENNKSSATITITVTNGNTNLLRDNFTVNESAPMASPSTCDVLGTLLVTQTDGNWSKSSGKAVFPAQASPNWGDQGLQDNAIRTRADGIVMRDLIRMTSLSNAMLGWGDGGVSFADLVGLGLWILPAGQFQIVNSAGSSTDIGELAAINTDYEVALAMSLNGGSRLFVNRKLVWRSYLGTADAYATFLINYQAAGNLDYADVTQFGGFWLDDNLFLLNQANPVSGTVYDTVSPYDNSPGSAFILLKYTLPATTAGAVIELKFNWIDDTHCWIARVKRNTGNTNWDYELVKVDGTEAVQITVTGIGTNGEIAVKIRNSSRDGYVNAQNALPTKRGAQSNVAFQNTATKVKVVTTGSGWTLTSLQIDAIDNDLYERLAV